uniref:DDE-1 domain-containing protein n=1 Tax=Ditylenchus dipsaci TaxID=166011 RepID=A0A915EID3_9BILA
MAWSELEIGRIVGELNFASAQNMLQTQNVSTPINTPTAQQLTAHKDCPNIPLLRDGSNVLVLSDGVMDTDQQITTVSSFQAPYTSATTSIKSKKAGRRKTKHQNRRNQQQQHKQSSSRNVLLQPLGEDADETEDDSTAEDIYEEFNGAGGNVTEVGKKKAKDMSRKKRERYADDLDALFALAHSDQNFFSMRFACCEGLLSHGYRKQAFLLARELAIELLNSPPNVMPCSNSTSTINADSENVGKELPRRSQNRHVVTTNATSIVTLAKHMAVELEALAMQFPMHGHLKLRNFEATVMGQTTSSNSLALELALKVMRNPRGPSATRSLEVYIYHLPCDQGIIQNVKVHYRRFLLRKRIDAFDAKIDYKMDLFKALQFLRRSWSDVKQETIANCFKKAGFIKHVEPTESAEDADAMCNELIAEMDEEVQETGREEDEELNTLWAELQQMNLAEGTLQEYLGVDDQLTTGGSRSLAEIAEEVSNVNVEEPEGERQVFALCDRRGTAASHIREAAEALNVLQRYADANANPEIQLLCDKVDNVLAKERIKMLKQKNLLNYFAPNQ